MYDLPKDLPVPTDIVFQPGSIKLLPKLIRKYNAKHILIFTGSSSLKKSGVLDRILTDLRNFNVELYDNFGEMLTLESVKRTVENYKNKKIDLVIAIGGGTVLDGAKCFSLLFNNSGNIEDYLKSNILPSKKSLPIICIPTTCGTSSEITSWATVWDIKNKRKYSLSHSFMYPDAAIIDPELMLTLPKQQTALTGMDALCHAVEAYWSKNANDISDKFALEAIKLIIEYLPQCYSDQVSIEKRTKLAYGVLCSGLAFSQTKTTICHALSYPLTIHYHVPHGQAVSIFLPIFLIANYTQAENSKIKEKFEFLIKELNCKDIGELSSKIIVLMNNIGLHSTLRYLNLKNSDLKNIISEGLTYGRAANNPKNFSNDELMLMLNSLI